MDFQYYATCRSMAKRAWLKFKNRNFVRVMDPSAGEGHLLSGLPDSLIYYFEHKDRPFDVCEIDARFHSTLRAQKMNIVGHDFLQYKGGAWLSHIIMNPPFAYGVEHVLHAWDILWDGEIVAIINAETLRNPFSKQRKHLLRLIELHGEVEYVSDGFNGPDAIRKTDVEVALVFLRKCADVAVDITGDLFSELRHDSRTGEDLAADFKEEQQLAHCNSSVENMVLAFDAAVYSMRAAAFANAKAAYYSRLLGENAEEMEQLKKERQDTAAVPKATHAEAARKRAMGALTADVKSALHDGYRDLKVRAWKSVLKSSAITDRLSSEAKKRLDAEFENIQQLEFTVSNIYGFLLGIVEKQGELQLEMACEVFDAVTRYHSENVVFYKGWKSNDRHRTCGMRMRTNRFILPKFAGYIQSLDGDSVTRLGDLDKVFAMLDGKAKAEYGLVELFSERYADLREGLRLSSSYFDVRYFPLAGTIHFFARDKALVDRLNRLVGHHRQWLPPQDASNAEPFWKQYESAEKLDKEFREQVAKLERADGRHCFSGYGALGMLNSGDESIREAAHRMVDEASTMVLQKHGMDFDERLEHSSGGSGQLRLAAA